MFSFYTHFMLPSLPPSWQLALASEFQKSYWESLSSFIKSEYSQNICFPKEQNIFKAFNVTPFENVKVVILGQDPYHTAGAAMGLAFSVANGSKAQPSLRNILKELESDI